MHHQGASYWQTHQAQRVLAVLQHVACQDVPVPRAEQLSRRQEGCLQSHMGRSRHALSYWEGCVLAPGAQQACPELLGRCAARASCIPVAAEL